MTDEGMMVAIPVEEYEHLKECKARLMEIHERRIAELRGQMAEMKMKMAINDATPTLNTRLL
jgi:hypothetical protein